MCTSERTLKAYELPKPVTTDAQMEKKVCTSITEESVCSSVSADEPKTSSKKSKDATKSRQKKRSYVTTANDKKSLLIQMIFSSESCTIKEAAQRLNINYSTAKHIAKTYKLE